MSPETYIWHYTQQRGLNFSRMGFLHELVGDDSSYKYSLRFRFDLLSSFDFSFVVF